MTFFLGSIAAYLLGSIPSAVWYGKIFHGVDIRQHGSGNAGATNSLRTLGKKAGIIVLLFDFFKGFLSVYLAEYLSPYQNICSKEWLQAIYGCLAIIGHLFPIFAQFKGGKGVATALGVIAAVNPMATLVCVVAFSIIVYTTRYVSLGSLLAGVLFPIQLALGIWGKSPIAYIFFGFSIFALLVITHRANIGRLIKGTENKFGTKK